MKCKIGFLMSKDESTKKMVPFFVKVRAKDIISETVKNTLPKTSKTYDPSIFPNNATVEEYLGIDYSSFHYTNHFISTNVIAGSTSERRHHGTFSSDITYRINRDGLYEIFGKQTITKSSSELNSHYGITLPYGCMGTLLNMNVKIIDTTSTTFPNRDCRFTFTETEIGDNSLASDFVTNFNSSRRCKHEIFIDYSSVSQNSTNPITFGFEIRGHL